MRSLLTPKEVAEQLNTAESNVLYWIRRGELPASKIGRAWRIRPEDLEKFVEERKNIRRDQRQT